MGEFHTGEATVIEVAPLADGSRAEPAAATFKSLRGNTTGISIGEGNETTLSPEFGEQTESWQDGVINSRTWQMNFGGRYHPEDEGYGVVETAGLATGSESEVYVRYYPLGKEAGKPVFKGATAVKGLNLVNPREGEITNNWNFAGRGTLTKATYSAPAT